MAIRCELDEDARRVLMTIDGPSTGRQVTDVILKEVGKRPDLIEWDWIQDVRAASGEVDNTDMGRVAEAFGRPERATYTVFVSNDPALPQWAKVMDHVFHNRSHRVTTTVEAADALLDRLRAD